MYGTGTVCGGGGFERRNVCVCIKLSVVEPSHWVSRAVAHVVVTVKEEIGTRHNALQHLGALSAPGLISYMCESKACRVCDHSPTTR